METVVFIFSKCSLSLMQICYKAKTYMHDCSTDISSKISVLHWDPFTINTAQTFMFLSIFIKDMCINGKTFKIPHAFIYSVLSNKSFCTLFFLIKLDI